MNETGMREVPLSASANRPAGQFRQRCRRSGLSLEARSHRRAAICVCCTYSREVASGHGDHTVRVWHMTPHGSTLRFTLVGHSRTPYSLHHHPLLEHLLASGDTAGEVRLWDTKRGTQLASYDFRRPGVARTVERIASMSWFPSTQQLCLGIVHKKVCYFWPLCDNGDALRGGAAPSPSPSPEAAASSSTGPSTDFAPNAITLARDEQLRRREHKRRQLELDDADDAAETSEAKRSKLSAHTWTPGAASSPQPSPSPSSEPAFDLLPQDWATLSERIRLYAEPSATSSNTPIPMIRAQLSWRFIHFHAAGDYLLLAERSVFAAHEQHTADLHSYERNSLILRVYCMDATKSIPHPETKKQELHLLGQIKRILFFSENGVAIHGDRLATCQWEAPPPVSHVSTSPAAVTRPFVNGSSHVPTLAIFSLRPGHIGECLVRLELDAYSFVDLTCLAFSPGLGEYLAVAYQVTNRRPQRRQARQALDVVVQATPVSSTPSVGGSLRLTMNRSRFSALSALTRMSDDDAMASAQAAGSAAAAAPITNLAAPSPDPSTSASPSPLVSASSSSSSSAPSSSSSSLLYRSSDSYSSLLSQSLEDHTFMSIYSSRDLTRVRQMTAPRSAASTHSINALVYSDLAAVGILAGTTNGDVLACTPAVRRVSEPSACHLPTEHTVAFAGRHRLPQYVQDEVVEHEAQLRPQTASR